MIEKKYLITGVGPLLFNRFPDEENEEGKSKAKTSKPTADEGTFRSLYWTKKFSFDDFVKSKDVDDSVEPTVTGYVLPKGAIYTPADHFLGAMTKAGASFKMEGRKTYKDAIKGGVFITPIDESLESYKLVHKKTIVIRDWRSVVVPATRGRVMRARGRLDEWELEIKVTCLDPRASGDDITAILQYAGQYVGIGDYRPRFGRFEVKELK